MDWMVENTTLKIYTFIREGTGQRMPDKFHKKGKRMISRIFIFISLAVALVFGADQKNSPNDTTITDTTVSDTAKKDSVQIKKPGQTQSKNVEKIRLNIDPELKIELSKYVNFTSTNLTVQNGVINFQGEFLVLGEGVFGHFDLQTFDSTGNRLKLVQSEVRNYRRDQGSKYKNVSINTTDTDSLQCYAVSVFFHEMRVEPDNGPCKR